MLHVEAPLALGGPAGWSCLAIEVTVKEVGRQHSSRVCPSWHHGRPKVWISASNITSISIARRGYTDRIEASDRNRGWHRDSLDFTRDRCRDIADGIARRENYYGPNPDDASHVLRSALLRSAHRCFLNRVLMMPLICASLSLGE